MGHRDFKTTLIYADYQPGAHELMLVERAFGQDANSGANVSETDVTSEELRPHQNAESDMT
jgi:arylamine N-acetyltransferase